MILKLLHLMSPNLVFETKIYIPDKSFVRNLNIAIEIFKVTSISIYRWLPKFTLKLFKAQFPV